MNPAEDAAKMVKLKVVSQPPPSLLSPTGRPVELNEAAQ
jgi:hypothetical protein